jgi:hypothetical protein
VILEKEAAWTSEKIVSGNIGAISTDNPAANGYYLVELSGQLYQTELVATSLQDTNPPTIVPKGEWLCVGQKDSTMASIMGRGSTTNVFLLKEHFLFMNYSQYPLIGATTWAPRSPL